MSRTDLISRLTPEQEARLGEWRDRWLEIGLRAEPADREGARAGVLAAYAAAGLQAPAIFVWLRSPFEGAIGTAALLGEQQVWQQVRQQVGQQVRQQVWQQVEQQVWQQVWQQVEQQVWQQVEQQVRQQVEQQVEQQVRQQVRQQVGQQVWQQVEQQVWQGCYGQHDASWLPFYDYFRVVVGLPCAERMAGMIRVAECCGWWWPLRGAVVLTERPTRLCRDARHRLHAGDGPAIEYPDGWGVYAWHGVRVPELVIRHPERMVAREILAESNAEIRRVMVERFGFDRLIAESGARPIHTDATGTLYRIATAGEPLVVVHVTNATPEPDGSVRKFFLRVPPQMERARQAVAWTFDVKEQEYAPTVES